ncbi:PREDICTED: cation/H(+) antiporter 26-like [Camelina sativa]|uniref:Cation/H(+) antiporter 26-like n=1 Tax=Camelina sativa TaxID=90675 RepID=A0ABM0XST7_CAMSA|nr:PREDICTED: cation/H(+) antiporter 26-like [Camelina sativa]
MNNSVVNGTHEFVCEAWLGSTSSGIFMGDDPLKHSTPLLLLLISLVSSLSSFFQALLRPLPNVDFVTQIMGGIFLGPSVLGQNIDLVTKLFNTRSFFIIESLEAISFMFISYISTAQVEVGVIKRGGKVAIINGFSLFLFPYVVGSLACTLITSNIRGSVANTKPAQLHDILTNQSAVYFQVAYSVLSKLKMLNSEPGRLALSSIMVTNCFGWGLFLLKVTFDSFLQQKYSKTIYLHTFTKVLLIAAIVVVCRPIFKWIVKRTPEGKKLKASHLCIICVMLCTTTFLSETVGFPYIVGSVALGLVTPKTPPLGTGLTDKIGCFCWAVLMPCYVIGIGNKVNFFMFEKGDVITLELLFFTIIAAKFASIVLPSLYFKVPISYAVIVGFIVCIQGIYDVQIFKQLLNYENISQEAFGIMVVCAMVHSTIFTAIVKNLYGWVQRQHITYRRQTVQHYEPNNPLKILTCFYHRKTVPSLLTILEFSSCPSGASIVSVNLEELEHHNVPLLIEHHSGQYDASSMSSSRRDQIWKAFEKFEKGHVLQENFSVECFTAVAPSKTMHEDVCALAFDKETNLIIVGIDNGNAADRRLCRNVLNVSPCSVAVLVDQRRLQDFKNMGTTMKNGSMSINVCSIFLGGADDREALAFAVRMTNHPCVNLNVLKLVDGENVSQLNDVIERRLDSIAIQKFSQDTMNQYNLREVRIEEASDIVNLLREEGNSYDLIMVGIKHEESFQVLKGLSVWSENEDLGEIADLLVSRDLKLTASVLAVQQQVSSVVEERFII